MAVICRDQKLLFIMVPGTGCSVVGNALRSELGGEWLPREDVYRNGRLIAPMKHNSAQQILDADLLSAEELREYLVVAIARNPFDRFVTYYQRMAGDWMDNYFAWTARDLERKRPNLTDGEYRRKVRRRERMIATSRRRVRVARAIGFNNWMKITLLRWYWEARRSASAPGRPVLSERAYPMLDHVDIAIRYEALQAGVNEVLRRVNAGRSIELPRKNVTPGKRSYREYYSWSTRRLLERVLQDDLRTFGHDFESEQSAPPLVELRSSR